MSIGARQPLSRELILRSAIQLVDDEGQSGLTMRRLASRLQVEAMSLYNHVDNKQDILDGMAALLISQMSPVVDSKSLQWQELLRAVCFAYRDLMAQHPAVFAVGGGRPLVSGEDHGAFAIITSALESAGFDKTTAIDIFQAGSTYTRGFALSVTDGRSQPRPDSERWNSDRAFACGLDAMIAGFARLLPTPD